MKIESSVDRIYETLQDEIVSLRLKPGDVLSENTLSERFSVSRTPIRSALQRLQQKGFVKIILGKGTIVTTFSLDVATQMIYKRVAIETFVFRDFVKSCTPTDVERVRYSLDCLEEEGKKTADLSTFDIDDFLKKDFEMHQIWFDVTNKSYLWAELTTPHADYSRVIRLDIVGGKNVPDVLTEHREMMRMIDERDPSGAEQLFSYHLYGGVRRLGNSLFSDEYRKYFVAE